MTITAKIDFKHWTVKHVKMGVIKQQFSQSSPRVAGLMFPLRFRDDEQTGLQFALLRNLLDGDDPNVFGAVHVPNEG